MEAGCIHPPINSGDKREWVLGYSPTPSPTPAHASLRTALILTSPSSPIASSPLPTDSVVFAMADRPPPTLPDDDGDLPQVLIASGILDSTPDDTPPLSDPSTRQPFTTLNQVDADLALARALQQQEHAYLLLTMGDEGSEYEESISGSVDYEYVNEGDGQQDADLQSGQLLELGLALGQESDDDEAGDRQVDELDFGNDNAFVQELQEVEHQNATAYMMGLFGVYESDGEEDDESYGSQDVWEDVDPDNMSYEELVALGEAVGTHNRGLKPDAIAALPHFQFVSSSTNSEDQCVICRFEYEDGDMLSTLPCKHHYHTDCIKNWLQINKVCPICSAEVTE